MKRRRVRVYAPQGYKAGGQSFEPHMMFDPQTGKGYKANTMQDHLNMADKGFLHKDEMQKKKKFMKKLQPGGTSTARQNQNINEVGSDRIKDFLNFTSTNAVNRITQEEGNMFANQVMRPNQNYFNIGGFNTKQTPLKLNRANQAALGQFADAYVNQAQSFKEGMGSMGKAIQTLTKGYDPTNMTIKSKTKVKDEFKPAWKLAVDEWKQSGDPASAFTFDPNEALKYNADNSFEYVDFAQGGVPMYNKGGKVEAIRKSIADKIRKGLSPKRNLKSFTVAERNQFTKDTANSGNYQKIKYDGIPVGNFVTAERQILNPSKYGKFSTTNLMPKVDPIKGVGDAAGEGEAPGAGKLTDEQLKERAAKFFKEQTVDEETQKAQEAAGKANVAAAEGKGFRDDPDLMQSESLEVLDPDREKFEDDELYAGDIVEDAEKRARARAKGTDDAEDTDESTDGTTDSEGNVNYEDEFGEDEKDTKTTDVVDVRDPGYTVPGTSIPWNVANTYLDYYKHRGRGLFRPDKTVMKFSHYADGTLPGMPQTGMPSSPNAPTNAAQSELDQVIAKNTEGLSGRDKRIMEREIKRAARQGMLDDYAQMGATEDPVVNMNDIDLGPVNPNMPLQEGPSIESQMRGVPTPEDVTPMGPEVDPNLEFFQDFTTEDGKLDIKALEAEGFNKKDIKAYKDAMKMYDDNVALTGDDRYAKGQLTRAAKKAFQTKNDRLLEQEIKDRGLKGADADAYRDRVKVGEFQDQVANKRAERRAKMEQEADAFIKARNKKEELERQAKFLENNPFTSKGKTQEELATLNTVIEEVKPKKKKKAKSKVKEEETKEEVKEEVKTAGSGPRFDDLFEVVDEKEAVTQNVKDRINDANETVSAKVKEIGQPYNLGKVLDKNNQAAKDAMIANGFTGDAETVFPTQRKKTLIEQLEDGTIIEKQAGGNVQYVPLPFPVYVGGGDNDLFDPNMVAVQGLPAGPSQDMNFFMNQGVPINDAYYTEENLDNLTREELQARNEQLLANDPVSQMEFTPPPPPPPTDPANTTGPKTEWADTKITMKETPFGGARNVFKTLFPGVGAGLAAIGNKINEPNNMAQMQRLTTADQQFAPMTGNAGSIMVNPVGVDARISAPVQFTGGAQYGGSFAGGGAFNRDGAYRMTRNELQQFLQGGGRIELID